MVCREGRFQSGNVVLALFAAIGLIGVIGATGMNVLKGPVRGMHNVTQKTIAQNSMLASAKLAIMATSNQPAGGDCDADGTVEPIAWTTTGTGPSPAGGGYLPSSIGASLQDPWGNTYGYCVWDHGTAIQTTCGTPMQRLKGEVSGGTGMVIAIVSSGPDRIFQTSCGDAPTYVARVTGSDDIITTYTYAEAQAAAAGLWNLQSGDPDTAEIKKNLAVKNAAGDTTFELDSTTGIGDFIGVRTGSIAAKGVEPVIMAGGLRVDNEVNVTQCSLPQHAGTLRYHTLDGLQICNGTEWVNAGGGGSELMVKAYQTNALNVTGVVTIPYNNEVIDTLNAFNPVTGVFTAPHKGIYMIDAAWYSTGIQPNICSYIYITKNGGYEKSNLICNPASTNLAYTNRISGAVSLAQNDTIQIQAAPSSGSIPLTSLGAPWQYLSITRIGAVPGSGGGGGESTGANLPNGTIVAFALSTCPAGWSEYLPARGRFLRGIDPTGSSVDPSGPRTPGDLQADEFRSHTHLTGQSGIGNTSGGSWFLRADVGNSFASGAAGGAETRPKNVAVKYCQYDGSGIGPNTDILDDLSDVLISGPVNGQVLTYNGSNWVNSTGSSQWVTAGSNIHYSTGNVGIGTNSPTTKLHINSTDPTITLQDTRPISNAALTAGMLIKDSAGTSVGFIGDGSAGSNLMQMWAYADRIALGTALAHPITFHTNYNPAPTMDGSERMRIAANGDVGIGTINPLTKLHVKSLGTEMTSGYGKVAIFEAPHPVIQFKGITGNRSGFIGYDSQTATANPEAMRFWVGKTTDDHGGTGEAALTIKANGNVGIAAPMPESTLHIVGNDSASPLTIDRPFHGPSIVMRNIAGPGSANSYPNITDRWEIYPNGVTAGGTASRLSFITRTPSGTPTTQASINNTGGLTVTGALGFAGGRGGLNYYNVSPYDQVELGVSSSFPSTSLSFFTNSVSRMNITPAGSVGVGTISPQETFHVAGNARVDGHLKGGTGTNFHIDATTAGWGVYLNYYNTGNVFARNTLLASSDLRLKKDIAPIESSLDKLMKIEGVYYNWKDPQRPGRQVGVIAQDVEKVFPELVQEDGDGFKTVSYSSLVAPLINAVKEIKAFIEKIAEDMARIVLDVKKIEAQNAYLTSEVERLSKDNELLHKKFDMYLKSNEAKQNVEIP